MIPASLLSLLEERTLGTIATVGPDGAPNLSPKGTFLALDDSTLAFAEMRSPNTVRNIAGNPKVEVNILDVLSRKGARFKGTARFVERGSAEFDTHFPRFEAIWTDLASRFNGIVLIDVTDAKPITSPAYDIGTSENDLRAHWLKRITEIQERHDG